MKLFYG